MLALLDQSTVGLHVHQSNNDRHDGVVGVLGTSAVKKSGRDAAHGAVVLVVKGGDIALGWDVVKHNLFIEDVYDVIGLQTHVTSIDYAITSASVIT